MVASGGRTAPNLSDAEVADRVRESFRRYRPLANYGTRSIRVEVADGVGVVVTACSGAVVEVGGPGVGVVGVAGEVDDCAAELFVDGPAEGDDFDLARLLGRGCGAG